MPETLGTEHFKLEAVTADRDEYRRQSRRLEDRVRELEMELNNLRDTTLFCGKCGAAMRLPRP